MPRKRKPTSPWRITSVTENRPDTMRKPGRFRINATDGVRVIHADVLPDDVATFDPESYWQTVLANSTKLPSRKAA